MFMLNRMIDNEALISGIVAGNIAIWFLWVYVNTLERYRVDPDDEEENNQTSSLGFILRTYFINSQENPFPSLFFSAFSHKSILHLYVNMTAVTSVAPIVIHLYGRAGFLAIYATGAVVSSITSLQLRELFGRRPVKSLGASGAFMSLMGAVGTSKFGNMAFVVNPYPHPIPAFDICMAFLALDSIGLLMNLGFIDHASHIGGMLFGLLVGAS